MSNVLNDSNVIESTENSDQESNYVTKNELSQIVNSAITSHLKRINVSKQVSDVLESSLAPFKEKLSSSEPAVTGKEDKNPEISALQKKLELMEKNMKAKEEALMAREKQSREKDVFAQIRTKIGTLGVRPEAVDHVAKILKAEDRVKISDDGDAIFVMDEDELDLDAGLKRYLDLKTNPSMSLYFPPKNIGKTVNKGIVQRISTETNQGNSEADKARRVYEQLQARNQRS